MRHESARHQVYVARIGYFLCGYAVACWAPLIPIVQSSLELSTEAISVLVLSFGIGSVSGMLLTNLVLTRIGFKLTYAISCATTALAISLVALTPSYFVIMGAVILFGVSIGALEVAINVFAAYIERRYRLMMMSVLFAYYSMGEVGGAVLMIVLLTLDVSPAVSIVTSMGLLYLWFALYIPRIIAIEDERPVPATTVMRKKKHRFVMPCEPVISLALITAFTYVVGGAVLDWSGLYVTSHTDLPKSFATIGYCIVCVCMLTCRLLAPRILRLIGPFNFAFLGAILMALGLLGVVATDSLIVMTASFFAIGIGMSNISPLATSAAGKQKKMPLVPAIAFISICGYTGLLLGPAVLGFIASTWSLAGIFVFLSLLTAVSASLIYRRRPEFGAIDPRKPTQSKRSAPSEEA